MSHTANGLHGHGHSHSNRDENSWCHLNFMRIYWCQCCSRYLLSIQPPPGGIQRRTHKNNNNMCQWIIVTASPSPSSPSPSPSLLSVWFIFCRHVQSILAMMPKWCYSEHDLRYINFHSQMEDTCTRMSKQTEKKNLWEAASISLHTLPASA